MTRPAPAAPRGILMRLRRDTRGGVLIYMAAILIPLLAFSGSAIDAGRLYAVKTRLQQACDAGALAGRKAMTDNTLDASAAAQAQTFFHSNFPDGWFQAARVSFRTGLTSDTQVQGTAQADVPMTLMAMFGQATRTLTVTCQARYDVPDADIMFVLDTTGSMACTTASDTGNGCGASVVPYTRDDGTTGYYSVEQSGSKIAGVRDAVLSFYDTLAASADSSTHIRYGFVPYTSTVNVGAAITSVSGNAMVARWQYQTRHAVGDNIVSSDAGTVVKASSATDCQKNASRSPVLASTVDPRNGGAVTVYPFNTDGTAQRREAKYTQNNGTAVCTVFVETVSPVWRYEQWPVDVGSFVAGAKVADPSKYSNATSVWQGCIEETNTQVASTFDQAALPPDLNPDLIPTTSVNAWGFPNSADTRWRPMWPDIVYFRKTQAANDDVGTDADVYHDVKTSGQYRTPYGDYDPSWRADAYFPYPFSYVQQQVTAAKGFVTCGMKAQRLKVMTRAAVAAYVNDNDFRAMGGTYHDTGMIWGTRMIAWQGLFAKDTAAWPGRQAPNRYIVFMTDGQMSTNKDIYGLYGLETYDQRVTGGDLSKNDDYHNARFVAECQAARARSISVFVIGFGQTLNTQLRNCATPGQAYYASDNAGLKAAFQKIAQQVAMLRVSK